MKYIIKNCPAYRTFYPDTGFYHNTEAKPFTACDAGLPLKKCQDETDCLLKQIVEKCKEQNLKYDTTACEILELLDIQEIGE